MDPMWIAAVVNPAVTAVVVSALTQHFITRRTTERIKQLESDLATSRFDHEQATEGEARRRERVREAVDRWGDDAFDAVKSLRRRLDNILVSGAHVALAQDCEERIAPSWSMTHSYYMNSTLYLFARLFFMDRILRLEIGEEVFGARDAKDEVVSELDRMIRELSSNRLHTGEGDRQVFRLQQQAIGEAVTQPVPAGDAAAPLRCLGYVDFLAQLGRSDAMLTQVIEPLRLLLCDLDIESTRGERLRGFNQALATLQGVLEQRLAPPLSGQAS
ncbi:MAG: hypothetical protein AB7S68_04590 [Polyangiaceae bacterium]